MTAAAPLLVTVELRGCRSNDDDLLPPTMCAGLVTDFCRQDKNMQVCYFKHSQVELHHQIIPDLHHTGDTEIVCLNGPNVPFKGVCTQKRLRVGDVRVHKSTSSLL